ncbi:MAG: MgtC/SapB family protein [Bacteroidaceae bacterium]|nr:MgtC/SapB family protein [Bacteroidaceae bacterium]
MNIIQTVIDLINSSEVNAVNAFFKLTLSFLLGAIIGLERRRKGQFAGMRTFAIISMGATLAMLVSIYIPQEYMGLKNGDPGRIAAQVISGIGFLGAGAIIQMKGSVRGLTTAAGIWIAACIGLAVGAGMYLIAIMACALIIFILVNMESYEHKIFRGGESKIIRVKVDGVMTDISHIRKIYDDYLIHIQDEFIKYEYKQEITILNFVIVTRGKSPDYIKMFSDMEKAEPSIRSITLTNEVNY